MKSNLYKIALFIWGFMPLLGFSQSNDVDKILKATPEITSFMKVGEYPVSYYTGTPDISIPLFTLKEGEFNMPINLTYAGTAIPVSEPSTWVGQNWNLFPGRYITRIVVGSMNEGGLVSAHQQFLKKKNIDQSQLLESYSNGVYGDVPL